MISSRFTHPTAICRITANSLVCAATLSLLALCVPAIAADASSAATPATTSSAALAPVAATEPYDLGEGLGYIRVQRITESLDLLSRTLPRGTALVLDLRYTSATDGDAAALAGALAQRTGGAPLFVLVSPQTPAALTPVLLKTSAVTLGVDESLPAPAVVVAQSVDADRRAYDAFAGGMPLETLIAGKIEKERFDEASLVKEFEHGNPNAAPPPEPDPTKPAPEKAPVLTDRVLQRAVHLHRALAALKRD
ncbi:MAG: hypothetical protein KF715_07130 [Candidatus Didemnitutus sp.]|nr:hypothetical protein [Candidatus Didemnitutus sp.]